MKFNTIAFFMLATFSFLVHAEEGPEIATSDSDKNFVIELVSEDVVVPWGMAQLPNGDLLVTEREGLLKVIRDGKMLDKTITGLPEISASGQGGLLDIALHPDYAKNGWVYFTYSSTKGEGEGSNTALMRAQIKNMRLVNKQLLYKGQENTTKGQHFGSRIVFDKQGYVYFSIGDRGARDVNPQNLSLDGGKIYRLEDDGTVPQDNPFLSNKSAKPAVFSYGHRNPQGLALHPVSGKIWAHEHGPQGGDEINLIETGLNYGWPIISYGINYDGSSFTDITEKQGMEQPKLFWDPSIAPSGMIFVTSDKYPHWSNKMLIGSMKFNYIVLVSVDGDNVVKQEKIFTDIGRVRSLYQGQDGFIYVGVDGQGIKKIIPKS